MFPNSAVGDVVPKPVLEACAELADRLWAGEDCRAEEFFPAVARTDSADAALELIYTEFVVREEMGQQPSPAEWLARFPQWRDRLERMLQPATTINNNDPALRKWNATDFATMPSQASYSLYAMENDDPPQHRGGEVDAVFCAQEGPKHVGGLHDAPGAPLNLSDVGRRTSCSTEGLGPDRPAASPDGPGRLESAVAVARQHAHVIAAKVGVGDLADGTDQDPTFGLCE